MNRDKKFLPKKDLLQPQLIRVGVSHACNHRCVMCWNYSAMLKEQKSDHWKNVMAEKEMLLNVIAEAKEIGFKQILFSGRGEPFTHPNILDFIRMAVQKRLGVILQTNLSLVDPIILADVLKNLKQRSIICVNLSAAEQNTYDKIHNQAGKNEFISILDKIKYLRNKKIRVRYVFVVIKQNYREIEEAFALNDNLETFLHLELADYASGKGVGKLAITKRMENEIGGKLSLIKKKYNTKNSNIDDFSDQLTYRGIGARQIYSCLIGNNFCSIDETGKVHYCFNMESDDYYMGNLTNNTLKQIWSSDKYNLMRSKLRKGDFLPGCKQYCLPRYSTSKPRGSNFKLRFFIDKRMPKPYA